LDKEHSVFFAYPSQPENIGSVITAGAERLHKYQRRIRIKTWEQSDIAGSFVSKSILGDIRAADTFAADITRLNFNVTYEVGYAIGAGKPIRLFLNKALKKDSISFDALGIYDTLGYEEYENSEQLSQKLQTVVQGEPLLEPRASNTGAPVYLNQSKYRTDHEGQIISRVKKANLHFRSFDPNETPRLSSREAIRQVSESLGVLVHFVPSDFAEADLHNLRAAFIAGLANGMQKEALLIQFAESPIPLDYRDLVTFCRSPDDYKDQIGKFASTVYELLQAGAPKVKRATTNFLAQLDLGSSTAENELTSLDQYYLEIPAYRRASRGEARLVTGRKGSGKTAILLRLHDSLAKDKSRVVLDLRPEGYQLRKFKDSVLTMMEGGTMEHLITAFWEYVLLLEIARKLVLDDHSVHKFDHRLFEHYQRLLAVVGGSKASEEGDFAERLAALLSDLEQTFAAKYAGQKDVTLLQPEITAFLYRHDIHAIRRSVFEYLSFKEEVWLFFDNLDKGWPTSGLHQSDLVMIRALLDATRKLEKEAVKTGATTHSVVFLRNDVYELLLDATSDRGKEARVNVDWTDQELLKEMLRKRIVRKDPGFQDAEFDAVWRRMCQPLVQGEDTAQFMIDRSLMRPRCLIDLVNHCLGAATSLRHEKISDSDIEKGFHAYSTDLISEISLEIRDVYPTGEDVLYAFIGANEQFSLEDLRRMLKTVNVPYTDFEKVRGVLFWFAFLGTIWPGEKPKYIYDVNYDMKLFLGAHDKFAGDVRYQVNPAFWAGLGIGGATRN
jgi:hypothetical protein